MKKARNKSNMGCDILGVVEEYNKNFAATSLKQF
jgi:hypothetical protein